jgi:hypothetical protein
MLLKKYRILNNKEYNHNKKYKRFNKPIKQYKDKKFCYYCEIGKYILCNVANFNGALLHSDKYSYCYDIQEKNYYEDNN